MVYKNMRERLQGHHCKQREKGEQGNQHAYEGDLDEEQRKQGATKQKAVVQ